MGTGSPAARREQARQERRDAHEREELRPDVVRLLDGCDDGRRHQQIAMPLVADAAGGEHAIEQQEHRKDEEQLQRDEAGACACIERRA